MTLVLRRLLTELRPHRGRVAVVALFGIVFAAAYSRLGFILKGILDGFTLREDQMTEVTRVTLLGLALAVVIAVSRYVHIFTMNMIAESVVNDLRLRLQTKFMNLSLSFHSGFASGSGGLMSRIMNDIKVIQDGLRMVADLFIYPLLAVLLLANLFYMNWRLTLTILIVLPAVLYFLRQISRSLRKYVLSGQENLEHITATIKESLDGVRTIQAFNLERMMSQKLRDQLGEYLQLRSKVHSRIEIMGPVTEFIATCVVLAIFYYFSSEVSKGNFTAGDIIAYIGMLLMINPPIKKLQESYVRVQETVVAATRLYAMLDDPSEVKPGRASRPFPANWSKIEYRDVSFAYGETPTLQNIDLEIRRGEQVAFIGESGSGKSTLVNLLGRFHDPTSGDIFIDGISIREIDLRDLRKHVALVSQDVFLFSDSIERNIQAGDFSRDATGVPSAARSANADEFITRLPKGYLSRAGDRGSLLSGGEKQRISIARALFKDAPILILDEATSALDSASEKEVQKGLDQLMQGRTSLVIAHRLSTVQGADRIHVLRAGKIVASGTHADLLARSAEYGRFWKLQTSI